MPFGSTTGSPVAGFSCNASPAFTGLVAVGQLSSCFFTTGTPISFAMGDAAFIEISEFVSGGGISDRYEQLRGLGKHCAIIAGIRT